MDQALPNSVMDLLDEASEATALFRAEVVRVQQARREAGLSYSVLDQAGQVVHVHPNGTIRPERSEPGGV